MRKVNNRISRINEEIRQELSEIITRELKDPRINSMTSILRTETTSDLKHCKVYVSVLGDQESQENTLKGLENSAGFIRNELAKSINLRNTPELHFVIDHSIEYGIRMSKIIDDVNQNNEKKKDE